jgi:hypothetical protein
MLAQQLSKVLIAGAVNQVAQPELPQKAQKTAR